METVKRKLNLLLKNGYRKKNYLAHNIKTTINITEFFKDRKPKRMCS